MDRQQLTDITRGLQHAAQTTLSLVAEQFILLMRQFFDPMEDGTLKAKMVRVQLSEETYVMVPLITLASPKGLSLDTMHVSLSVRLEQATTKPATSSDNATDVIKRTSFSVSMAPRGTDSDRRNSDVVDIEMEFKARESPEAIMRVIDLYTNSISPERIPPDGLEPTDYVNTQWFQELLKQYREQRGEDK